MKEYNIKDLTIYFEISSLLPFLESKKEFEIDFTGKIYEANQALKITPLVFRGKADDAINQTQLPLLAEALFGKEYKVKVEGNQGSLTPVGAWQNIIGLNQNRMSYFDHQTDGVEIFEDKELEDIGWQAISLEVNYRTLCTYLEKHCEGTFVYYDNGMHFNGFVLLEEIEDAKTKMFDCVHACLEEKIKNEISYLEELDSEAKTAVEFFKYKG